MDNCALFHNPNSFSDKDLSTMRAKLNAQRRIVPAMFLFGVAGSFAVDTKVFNTRYFGKRPYLVVLPGLACAVIGCY